MGIKISKDHLHPSVIESITSLIGDLNQLETTAKGNAVEAINELLANGGNKEELEALIAEIAEGKELIANAIGNESITVDSTFEDMSEAILELHNNTEDNLSSTEVLYNMMIEDGYNEATSNMTADELIDLLNDNDINITDIEQISVGYNHVLLLKSDGSLYGCGDNQYGQLGLADTSYVTTFTQIFNSGVKQISCNEDTSFIIKDDGSLWSCGWNNYGQLGLGTYGSTDNKKLFTQVTTNINNDVKQVSCGAFHTAIVKNDGSLWMCGLNETGGLGLNDNTNRYTFTQVTENINNDVKEVVCGNYHTFILKNDGSLWATGQNSVGQLGLGTSGNYLSTFTQVTTNVKQVACGWYHSFIIKNDGSLWATGQNSNGKLGLGDSSDVTTFTQVTTNVSNDVKQVTCKANHTMILKNDGTIWGCGYNKYGQLGLNDTTDRAYFIQATTNVSNGVTLVACGRTTTFALKNDGTIWGCGYNGYGQLDLYSTETPYKVFTRAITITGAMRDESEIDRLALYDYLLANNINVNKDMSIEDMLNLLLSEEERYIAELKSILEDKGIDVTEEDDMASLISKVENVKPSLNVKAGDSIELYSKVAEQSNEGFAIGPFNNSETHYLNIHGSVKFFIRMYVNSTAMYVNVKLVDQTKTNVKFEQKLTNSTAKAFYGHTLTIENIENTDYLIFEYYSSNVTNGIVITSFKITADLV